MPKDGDKTSPPKALEDNLNSLPLKDKVLSSC